MLQLAVLSGSHRASLRARAVVVSWCLCVPRSTESALSSLVEPRIQHTWKHLAKHSREHRNIPRAGEACSGARPLTWSVPRTALRQGRLAGPSAARTRQQRRQAAPRLALLRLVEQHRHLAAHALRAVRHLPAHGDEHFDTPRPRVAADQGIVAVVRWKRSVGVVGIEAIRAIRVVREPNGLPRPPSGVAEGVVEGAVVELLLLLLRHLLLLHLLMVHWLLRHLRLLALRLPAQLGLRRLRELRGARRHGGRR